MTNEEQKLREIVERWMGKKHPITMQSYVSDLTALITEGYVSKEEHAKILQQRDELREALEHIIEYWNRDRNDEAMHNALWEIISTAEAAIKNTDG